MQESLKNSLGDLTSKFENFSPAQFSVVILVIVLFSSAVFIGGVSQNKSAKTGQGSSSTNNSQSATHLSIKKFTPFVPDTFKIVFEYGRTTKNLSMKEFSILSDHIRSSHVLAYDSPYEVSLMSGNNVIFKEKVSISEFIFFDVPPGQNQPKEPDKILSDIYLPYYSNADKLVVARKGSPVFETAISPLTSSGSTNQQVKGQACGPQTLVIIGDGYATKDGFRQAANQFISNISGTIAYGDTSRLFNFQIDDDLDPTTCLSDMDKCVIGQAYVPALQKAMDKYNASGGVILLNGGRAGGVTVDIGQGPSVIDTAKWEVSYVERHEFLGHMIGDLYDRYLTDYGEVQEATRSNCTDNSNGEDWWGKAGAVGAQTHCSATNNYAPFPNTCGNLGNPNTMMGLCVSDPSNAQFDPVETYWIQNRVIPKFTCQPDTLNSGGGGASSTVPSDPNVQAPSCSDNNYSVTLSWTGSGQGWFVDISTDPTFGGWSNKSVDNVSSTAAPDGFSLNLSLQPGTTYYWRIYYGIQNTWLGGKSFNVPACSGSGGGNSGNNSGGQSGQGGGGTSGQTYSATIPWNSMPDAAGGYEIDFVNGTTPTQPVRTNATSYTFTGLQKGSYGWTVWALDANGNKTSDNVGVGQMVGY